MVPALSLIPPANCHQKYDLSLSAKRLSIRTTLEHEYISRILENSFHIVNLAFKVKVLAKVCVERTSKWRTVVVRLVDIL